MTGAFAGCCGHLRALAGGGVGPARRMRALPAGSRLGPAIRPSDWESPLLTGVLLARVLRSDACCGAGIAAAAGPAYIWGAPGPRPPAAARAYGPLGCWARDHGRPDLQFPGPPGG